MHGPTPALATARRPATFVPAAFLAIASLSMIAVRTSEAFAGNPLAWLRIAASIGAVAVLFFARQTLVKRALLAIAIETLGGVATLAYVDVPFAEEHIAQISATLATTYRRVGHRELASDVVRFERAIGVGTR